MSTRRLALRSRRDWQSLGYLVAAPALVAWQWVHGVNAVLYAALLFLTLGVGVIHHNHAHLRMFTGRRARPVNRALDYLITLEQGHPTFVFWPAHGSNHHRYKHGPLDVARTYRFGGDTNDLMGYLLHPFQAAGVLYPLFVDWLRQLHHRKRGVWVYCMGQYGMWLGSWAVLLAMDPVKAIILVIMPQLHGLHWLLATNYLQHAHADGAAPGLTGRRYDYARNFEGWVNPLLFNIGLHTAHHEHPRVHWSALTRLHRCHYRARVHPSLNEGGLLPYMARVFVLGLFSPARRSHSRMAGSDDRTETTGSTHSPDAPTNRDHTCQ